MNHALPLNEDQRDCLQEVTNVAIGAAAESLANFTHQFVCLPIPIIRPVDASSLVNNFDESELHSPLSAMSQHYLIGDFCCQVLMVVSDESFNGLADFAERQIATDKDDASLLQDLFFELNDTCFERLSEMFELPVVRQTPSLEGIHIPPEKFDLEVITNAKEVIAIEVDYKIENSSVSCHMFLLFTDHAVKDLVVSLDRLLN